MAQHRTGLRRVDTIVRAAGVEAAFSLQAEPTIEVSAYARYRAGIDRLVLDAAKFAAAAEAAVERMVVRVAAIKIEARWTGNAAGLGHCALCCEESTGGEKKRCDLAAEAE